MTASMCSLSLPKVPGRTGRCSFSAWLCSGDTHTRDFPGHWQARRPDRPSQEFILTSFSFSFRTRSTVSTSECCWTLCCRSCRHTEQRDL